MRIWVKPAGDDRRVPWPTTGRARRYFPNDAATNVERDDYIDRLLRDGDLVQQTDGAAGKLVPKAAVAAATDQQSAVSAAAGTGKTPAPEPTKAEG